MTKSNDLENHAIYYPIRIRTARASNSGASYRLPAGPAIEIYSRANIYPRGKIQLPTCVSIGGGRSKLYGGRRGPHSTAGTCTMHGDKTIQLPVLFLRVVSDSTVPLSYNGHLPRLNQGAIAEGLRVGEEKSEVG